MTKRMMQLRVGCVLACVAVLVGCEYTNSGDSGSWNSDASWVNFSGVYKAAGGGPLVSAFSSGGGGGTTEGGTNFINVANEVIEEGDGSSSQFSGVLDHAPLVPGSLSITAGGYELNDDDADGSLEGSNNSSGTIDYGTGAWSIDLGVGFLADGVAIRADYSYAVSTGGGNNQSGGGGSGSSGKSIFSFTVFQTGNKLEITDNNGAKYSGRFGGVATTSGLTGETDPNRSPTDTLIPSVGDTAVAEYTAEGTSAAGVHVMLAGTFQGVVSRGSDGNALFFSGRRMLGTWVESKGVTGDINGQASPIGIAATTTTTP